jgi:type II secretory pathway component PulC
LVGIAWSNDPEAMIEDGKNKRTFFVKRGQTLDDEVKVVTIFKDKVILTFKGKEFELR